MNEIPDACPTCGLVLLQGNVLDAAGERDRYGPILGIDKDADPHAARAGYIGLCGMWVYDKAPEFYRCPRCHTDPIAATSTRNDGCS